MNNTLLDNSSRFTLVDYVKQLLSDKRCDVLKIATGYWDLPGTKLIYNELKDFFERDGKFYLLIGQEPAIRSYMLTEEANSEKFPDFYIQRDVAKMHDEYKDVVELLSEHMNPDDEENSQLLVHVYGQGEEKQFLHAKCYIFLGSGIESFAHGIIGSSNFTQKGLEENAELNYLETDATRVAATPSPFISSKSHLTWFDEKWQNSVPWTGEFIKILSSGKPQPSIGVQPVQPNVLTPYEVYIWLLQNSLGTDNGMDITLLNYLENTKYNSQLYQLDAVKMCYNIMLKMGGFMLADVVGLGKTIVATLVIRYYLENIKKNNDDYNNVLLIVPPAVIPNWEETIDELDKGNPSFCMKNYTDIVSYGILDSFVEDLEDEESEIAFKKDKNYGFIVIDESHRFRNKGTLMYNSLDTLIKNIRSITGFSPYVGLISATPQNNRPEELQNQISLFVPTPTHSQFTRITGCDFSSYFADVKKKYKEIVDPIADRQKLIDLSNDIRDTILNEIIVRRTRTDIVNSYPGTISFPTTVGPNILTYNMSTTLAQLFSDSVDIIDPTQNTNGIGYHRYSAIARLTDPQHRQRYQGRNMDVQTTSDRLAKIMKLLLIKRLESSFDAFKESLENLGRYTKNMIDMWNDDAIFICPQLDVNAIIANHATNRQSAYVELRNKIKSLPNNKNNKGQNAEYRRADFDQNYINDLQTDKQIIDTLLQRWQANTEDPKHDKFEQQLPILMSSDRQRLKHFLTQTQAYLKEHPEKEKETAEVLENLQQLYSQLTDDKTKLVIFTEAIPTAKKITQTARKLNYRVLEITATNRDSMKDVIRENFDANYNGQQKDDYDIIVTTEVLAEGVSLHRANAILNYDSPWNAARLIQRIGRVNRIGSKSKAVFVYNFFPSAQGNTQINLIENAYRKLQAFHTQFGEDDRVFNPREILSPAAFNTVVAGPASWQVKYLKELKDYKQNNETRFDEIMALNTPMQIAANATEMCENTAETLCVVNNSSASNSFYVSVDNTATETTNMSLQEIIEHCQCQPNAQPVALPTNINQLEQMAKDAYANLMQQRTRPNKNDSIINDAKRILVTLWSKDNRFDSVRPTLAAARQLIDGGDRSAAILIKKIQSEIESTQLTAPLTEQQVVDIINNKLKNVAQNAQRQIGTNDIFITFNKQ